MGTECVPVCSGLRPFPLLRASASIRAAVAVRVSVSVFQGACTARQPQDWGLLLPPPRLSALARGFPVSSAFRYALGERYRGLGTRYFPPCRYLAALAVVVLCATVKVLGVRREALGFRPLPHWQGHCTTCVPTCLFAFSTNVYPHFCACCCVHTAYPQSLDFPSFLCMMHKRL